MQELRLARVRIRHEVLVLMVFASTSGAARGWAALGVVEGKIVIVQMAVDADDEVFERINRVVVAVLVRSSFRFAFFVVVLRKALDEMAAALVDVEPWFGAAGGGKAAADEFEGAFVFRVLEADIVLEAHFFQHLNVGTSGDCLARGAGGVDADPCGTAPTVVVAVEDGLGVLGGGGVCDAALIEDEDGVGVRVVCAPDDDGGGGDAEIHAADDLKTRVREVHVADVFFPEQRFGDCPLSGVECGPIAEDVGVEVEVWEDAAGAVGAGAEHFGVPCAEADAALHAEDIEDGYVTEARVGIVSFAELGAAGAIDEERASELGSFGRPAGMLPAALGEHVEDSPLEERA